MKFSGLVVGAVLLAGASLLFAGGKAKPNAAPASHPVSFAKAINFSSPVLYPGSLAAGDLNGDGIPDLSVVSGDNNAPLEYAMGKGNGHFRPWKYDDNVGYAPGFVVLANVDGDGNLDAITTDGGSSNLYIQFGDGKGNFPTWMQLPTGTPYSAVNLVVADLNGDGIPDIVGTLNTGTDPGEIFVLIGKGNRQFSDGVTFSSGGYSPAGIAVGDLNHDGVADLVVTNNGQYTGPYGSVAVLLGKGDGTFDLPKHYLKGSRPVELVLGDFNGDNNLDLAVVGGTEHVDVLLGNGDGTFSRHRNFKAGIAPHGIAVADFNGDGILDLAVLAANVSVLLGNGDGTFQVAQKFQSHGHPNNLTLADFNHDGKPDIATIETVHGSSFISILLNTTQFPTPQVH